MLAFPGVRNIMMHGWVSIQQMVLVDMMCMGLVDIGSSSHALRLQESHLPLFMLGHLLDHRVFIGVSIQLLDSTVLKLALLEIG
jgi:hypothetical protein